MTETEFAKWIKNLQKQERKFTSEYLFNCGENRELVKMLIEYMNKYLTLFVDEHEAKSRKFIKWVLNETIKSSL